MNEQKNSSLKTVTAILLILGLLVFFILQLVPLLYSLLMSFKDYTPLFGIFGSPYVGMRNYNIVLGQANFAKTLSNTVVMSVGNIAVSAALAVPISCAVGSMAGGRRRSLTIAALLLPAFAPDLLVTASALFTVDSQLFTSNQYYHDIYIALASIRTASIYAFTGASAASLMRDRGGRIMRGAGLGVLIAAAVDSVGLLSSRRELYLMLSNPLVYASATTLDFYSYRAGMQSMQYSAGAAGWCLKTMIQLIPAFILAFVLTALNDRDNKNEQAVDRKDLPAGMLFGLLAAVLFAACVVLPVNRGAEMPTDGLVVSAAVNSAIITVLSTVLFAVLLFALSAGLYNWYNRIMLIVLLVLSAITNNVVGEYIFYRGLGLINTYLSVILSSIFDLSFILIIALLTRLKRPKAASLKELIRAMLPYLAIFTGLYAANMWGEYGMQTLYIFDTRHHGLSMLVRSAVTQGSTGGVVLLYIVIPVIIIAVMSVFAFVFLDNRE